MMDPQQSEERAVLHDYESEQAFMRERIVWISYSVCEGVSILEMIPVLCLNLAGVCAEVVYFSRVCPQTWVRWLR